MKIKITVSENLDGAEIQEMTIDGEDRMSVYPLYECPEDAIIGRDLVSCEDVAKLMEEAYEAGENGEEFVLVIE